MSKYITTFIILPLIVSISGCAGAPKTVDDLRSRFQEGSMWLKSETHTVKRPLKDVVDSFKHKAITCFNATKSVKEFSNGYYSTASSTAYLAVLKRENKNMYAFTIQDNIGNAVYIGGVPKGGQYNFLADIQKINKSTTKVTLNGIHMKSTKYFDAVLAWASGKNASCPL